MEKIFSWQRDLSVGLVVFLVALPLCLGIGLASTKIEGIIGLPSLFSVLIAGIVGGIVVGAVSGSRLGVSGPAAGLITIVLASISTLGSLETLLRVEATDKLDPGKNTTPPNRELVAQGIGNLVSGIIGGLPLTQVIVRSSANINAGGKSKIATIFHGVLLLFAVMFMVNLLNTIPLSVLAAILILIGYKLASFEVIKKMYNSEWDQFIPFFSTIMGVIFTDLLKGIAIGFAVAVFFILKRNFKIILKKQN